MFIVDLWSWRWWRRLGRYSWGIQVCSLLDEKFENISLDKGKYKGQN